VWRHQAEQTDARSNTYDVSRLNLTSAAIEKRTHELGTEAEELRRIIAELDGLLAKEVAAAHRRHEALAANNPI